MRIVDGWFYIFVSSLTKSLARWAEIVSSFTFVNFRKLRLLLEENKKNEKEGRYL